MIDPLLGLLVGLAWALSAVLAYRLGRQDGHGLGFRLGLLSGESRQAARLAREQAARATVSDPVAVPLPTEPTLVSSVPGTASPDSGPEKVKSHTKEPGFSEEAIQFAADKLGMLYQDAGHVVSQATLREEALMMLEGNSV